MKRLGIDLGTNSLGWAVFEDEAMREAPVGSEAPNPIACGVVVFPEGLERDKSDNLKSPAAERRAKRAARRLIFRRRLRKFHMLRALMELGMCPLSEEGFKAWKEEGRYPLKDAAFMDWLKSTPEHNPYADRAAAAEGKVDALTLGRALYHLAQRRGFRSSRKERVQELLAEEAAVEAKGKKATRKAKSDDDLGVVKQAIKDLTEALEREKLTLGQYFFRRFAAYATALKEGRMAEAGALACIRGQRTGRVEHYEKEFARIAEVQGLAPETRDRLRRILFFQRPLRIQRHLVGWCTLEKGRPYRAVDAKGKVVEARGHKYRRCLEGHPDYERFRALAFLNNLRISVAPEWEGESERLRHGEGRALTADEREAFLAACVRKTSWKVADALAKVFGKKTHVRSNHRPGDEVPMMPMRAALEALDIAPEQWERALNALYAFDDADKLIAWAQKPVAEHGLGLEAAKARRFACIDAPQERAAYSLHAIRKILPFLEKGFMLRKAIFCAKLPDLVPDYAVHEAELLEGLSACEEAWAEERAAAQADPLHRRKPRPLEGGHYRDYLRERWGVDEAAFAQLYVDTAQPDKENPVLPPVDLNAIRNPLVNRALTVLRRLVNALRREGTIDADTHIFIELARNVNNANACRAIERWQEQRQKARERAREFLRGRGLNANDEALILKHILWEEQGEKSVYTGQPIPQEAIASADYEIEHTIPRSRGGSSELWNLTLCERHYNVDLKGGRLPTECPNAEREWCDPAHPGVPYPALAQSAPLVAWEEKRKDLEAKLSKKPVRGSDPAAYAQSRQKWLLTKLERDYWAKKVSTFHITTEEVETQGFIPRQMVDTGIMTKYAVRFLKTRYDKVFARNGAATATARRLWGIQQEGEEKSRANHIHHAVDACVIAALDQTTFTALCTQIKQGDTEDAWERKLPPPRPDFASRVHQATEAILIRHLPANRQVHPIGKKSTRLPEEVLHRLQKEGRAAPRPGKADAVRGSLHNDTLYGRIRVDGEEKTVLRKGLKETLKGKLKKEAPTAGDIANALQNVVDKGLREALAKQIADYVQAGISTKELLDKPFFAPNGLPVKSVRMLCGIPKNPDPIRVPHPELPPTYGSGGDVLYFSVQENVKTGELKSVCVSLLQTVKDPASVVFPNEKFRIYPSQLALAYEYSPEELRTLTPQHLSKRLYVVTFVEKIGAKVNLLFHQEARGKEDIKDERKKAGLPQEASNFDYTHGTSILRLSPSTYFGHLLFENVHFRLTLDGRLEWL